MHGKVQKATALPVMTMLYIQMEPILKKKSMNITRNVDEIFHRD